jgi:N-acetyl-anhydromuramyl-L-alanine amidase AmpD
MPDWFDWIENLSIHDAFHLLAEGEKLEKAEAQQLVFDLEVEGYSHSKRLIGEKSFEKYLPSKRHGSAWKRGNPRGWVDHYTAGISARGTVLWFSNRDRETPGNSSAHYIMSRRGVIITIVNPLSHIAWHATVANPTHIGIEHVNAGLLSKAGSKVLYMGRHTYPLDRVPYVQELSSGIWEPYLSQQLSNNIVLKRLLLCAAPTLQQEYFVDHQVVDPIRKKDCGPLWPLKNLNRLVFSWKSFLGFKSLEPTVMQKNAVALFNSEVDDLFALV